MLNVSKRSLVDTEFSVSTFGMENSNFLPSSKVVHSSLCAAFGVSAWGSLGKKKKLELDKEISLPPLCCHCPHVTRMAHLVPQALQPFAAKPRLGVTGRKLTLALLPHHALSQAVTAYSHRVSVSSPKAAPEDWKSWRHQHPSPH